MPAVHQQFQMQFHDERGVSCWIVLCAEHFEGILCNFLIIIQMNGKTL